MDAVTYPQKNVVEFIGEHLVPLRVSFNDEAMASKYNVTWTPTLIVLDSSGKEHQRTVGFLEPDELIPSLLLGISKVFAGSGSLSRALHHLDILLQDFPRSGVVPEALYFRGVTLFKDKHDPKELKKAYEHLREMHPESIWAKRAEPYRLL